MRKPTRSERNTEALFRLRHDIEWKIHFVREEIRRMTNEALKIIHYTPRGDD